MSITVLFILLAFVSAATYLIIGAVVLLIKSQKIERSSEIVKNERTAQADARPSEVVNHCNVATQAATAPVEIEINELETHKPVSLMPSTFEEWRLYDEPACLRRQGNFVLV